MIDINKTEEETEELYEIKKWIKVNKKLTELKEKIDMTINTKLEELEKMYEYELHPSSNIWDEPKSEDFAFLLLTDGEVIQKNHNSSEQYVQGNVSCEKEALEFISKQRDIRFAIRKFMAHHLSGEPYWYLISYGEDVVPYHSYAVSTEWRFGSAELALLCLNIIGEDNWKKYVLCI